jgi:hypothetical protein
VANLRSRRPRLDSESFIAAAEAPPPATTRPTAGVPQRPSGGTGERRGEVSPPWTRPGVRPDVTKAFNLRLPEPLKLKLDFIRRETRISVHEFIMTALVPAVDAEVERLQHRRK